MAATVHVEKTDADYVQQICNLSPQFDVAAVDKVAAEAAIKAAVLVDIDHNAAVSEECCLAQAFLSGGRSDHALEAKRDEIRLQHKVVSYKILCGHYNACRRANIGIRSDIKSGLITSIRFVDLLMHGVGWLVKRARFNCSRMYNWGELEGEVDPIHRGKLPEMSEETLTAEISGCASYLWCIVHGGTLMESDMYDSVYTILCWLCSQKRSILELAELAAYKAAAEAPAPTPAPAPAPAKEAPYDP